MRQSWRSGEVLTFTRGKFTVCSCHFQGGQLAFAWALRRRTRGKRNSSADYRKSTVAAEKRNYRKTRNDWKHFFLCRYTCLHAERWNAEVQYAHSNSHIPVRSCWRMALWNCFTGVWWSSTWTQLRSCNLTSINSAWAWSSTDSWRLRFVDADMFYLCFWPCVVFDSYGLLNINNKTW